MKLVICAQDIRSIHVGLVRDAELKHEATIETQPEGYLKALDQTLKKWKIFLTDLSQIVVVTGPGSFTASRVSTTIANALSFTKKIPVLALENPNDLSLKELDLSAAVIGARYVKPTYEHPPEITVSKKGRGDNNADSN